MNISKTSRILKLNEQQQHRCRTHILCVEFQASLNVWFKTRKTAMYTALMANDAS